jgi:FkbH-like protein
MQRKDQKCANFLYGVYCNKHFSGLFDWGADIRFRRWSKLETNLYKRALTPSQHRRLQTCNHACAKTVNTISDVTRGLSPKRRFNGAFALSRSWFLKYLSGGQAKKDYAFDEFAVEAYVPDGDSSLKLILEYSLGNLVRLRRSIALAAGQNFQVIPCGDFPFRSIPWEGTIKIYPEESKEARIIFTWLDFVRHKRKALLQKRDGLKPAPKVKCVAWDLDHTLWEGILAEDAPGALKPNREALRLLEQFDDRGILQTIVSKNDFGQTWRTIGDFGLQDYFLYPAINWGQKSANIEQIAKRLNIDIDSFALIDDSDFEQAEVQEALPQVRVYSTEDISTLLTRPEFDIAITQASKTRRLSYLTEVGRNTLQQGFTGNYEDFLRSCRMSLSIFVPREEAVVLRCLELMHRSNQLNLSGRRYTKEEFNALLSDSNLLCLAIKCRDRFGDYGVVGFISIDESKEIPVVEDLAVSCRIAQKMVERTFFKWLALKERKRGKSFILAKFIRSKRNNTLLTMLNDISFRAIKEKDGHILLELPLERILKAQDVMKVEAQIS